MKMQRQHTTDDQDNRITWPASYSYLDVEVAGHARYLAGHADGLRDGRDQLLDEQHAEAIHQAAAERLSAAHLKLLAVKKFLDEEREARDSVIRAILDAGASRHEIAGASFWPPPATRGDEDRCTYAGSRRRLAEPQPGLI